MTELPERLRAWSDDAVMGRRMIGASHDLREAAREIDALREIVKLSLEYWEGKDRRYKTRFPAWVRLAVMLGFSIRKWK